MRENSTGKDEIIEFTKKLVENLTELDNIVESSLENIDEYGDDLSEIIGPVKSFVKVINLAKKIRLKSFIKSYAKKINNEIYLDEKEIEKLIKYMESKNNLEFIADIIDSAVNSKCSLASSILV
jgi:Na+/phosphate symporter